jgi:signal transduction histidine kinase
MKLKRSLLQRLVIGQLLVVVLFSILAVGNLFWQFYKQGEGEFDQHIYISASTVLAVLEPNKYDEATLLHDIKLLVAMTRTSIAYEKTGKALSESGIDIALRVVDQGGNEIYRTPEHANLPLASLPIGHSDFTADGKAWRSVTVTNNDKSLTVQLAQTSSAVSNELFDIVGRFILWPLFWFLPIAGLMTWLATTRGLSPLREFAQMISRRSPSDLKPLEQVATYKETEPLINEINSLLHKLDTTLTRERNFLADAAHELRTPLAVIQAQAHVLRHATTDAEKNTAAEELNIGTERAASLIQKLLLTARVSVEDFAPRFEVTDLTAFAQERIARFSVLAANKAIDMELTAPPHCFAKIDRETFASAIDNVLDNAIRYTPRDGAIKVEIAPLANDKVRLRIADNGQGIAPELHERVFERFFRVTGSEQQGSGLGLAIVKRVLALHGGDVALSGGLDRRGLAVDLTVPVGA